MCVPLCYYGDGDGDGDGLGWGPTHWTDWACSAQITAECSVGSTAAGYEYLCHHILITFCKDEVRWKEQIPIARYPPGYGTSRQVDKVTRFLHALSCSAISRGPLPLGQPTHGGNKKLFSCLLFLLCPPSFCSCGDLLSVPSSNTKKTKEKKNKERPTHDVMPCHDKTRSTCHQACHKRLAPLPHPHYYLGRAQRFRVWDRCYSVCPEYTARGMAFSWLPRCRPGRVWAAVGVGRRPVKKHLGEKKERERKATRLLLAFFLQGSIAPLFFQEQPVDWPERTKETSRPLLSEMG